MSDDDKIVYCDFCDDGQDPDEMYYKDKSYTSSSEPNCCGYCWDQFSDEDSWYEEEKK